MKRNLAALLAIAAYGMVACGGGSPGSSSLNTAPTTVSITGTIATGSAISDAEINIIDATGAVVATGISQADGSYTVEVPRSATAPLVIRATKASQDIFSVAPEVSAATVNVNQLTNATVALLSPSGNVQKFVAEIQNGDAEVSTESISSIVERLNTVIAPVKEAIESGGGRTTSFLNGIFQADGTGTDKLLDTIQVDVEPALVDDQTVKTAQVVYKVAANIDSTVELPGIKFASTESLDTLATSASTVNVSQDDLPSNELGALYSDFVARHKACYAQPLAERVSNGEIISEICKSIFKDSDPNQFLHAGKTASEVYVQMFTSTSQISFDAQREPYRIHSIKDVNGVPTGKAVVGVTGEGDAGVISVDGVVEVYDLNGKRALGATGDQNPIAFTVAATSSTTSHPLASDNQDAYVASYYDIYLPSNAPFGKTIKRAIVTTPSNKTIILGTRGARNQLFICKSTELDLNGIPTTNCTSTPQIYMAFRYVDQSLYASDRSPYQSSTIRGWMTYAKSSTNTSCPEVQFEYNGSTINPGCPLTDNEVESYKPGGLWTAKYEYTDGSSSTTLRTRHAARALSNRELMAANGPEQLMPNVTAETITEWKNLSQAAVNSGRAPDWWLTSPNGDNQPVWSPATGGYPFAWSVGEGQLEPRRVFLSGAVYYYDSWESGADQRWPSSALRPAFDEIKYFPSKTTRSTSMTCTLANESDISCDGVTGTWVNSNSPLTDINQSGVTTNFAKGSYMHYAQLWTFDDKGRNIKREYNLYTP